MCLPVLQASRSTSAGHSPKTISCSTSSSFASARDLLSSKYSYTLFLFTTPYIMYSLVLSGLYVVCPPALRARSSPCRCHRTPILHRATNSSSFSEKFTIRANRFHPLTLIGSLFRARPVHRHCIFGAIAPARPAAACTPMPNQLIAYKANDQEKRIGGLVLEVKGDFCHKINGILTRYGREQDYVES